MKCHIDGVTCIKLICGYWIDGDFCYEASLRALNRRRDSLLSLTKEEEK